MILLLAMFLGSGGPTLAKDSPAIIPWQPGPRDTVFVELGSESGGCVYVDSTYVEPPYSVSAAFAARADSQFLGIAINRVIPSSLQTYKGVDVHPDDARNIAFVWSEFDPVRDPNRFHDMPAVARNLGLVNPRIASADAKKSGSIWTVTIQWKNSPTPWVFDVGWYPWTTFFQSPSTPGMRLLREAGSALSTLRRKYHLRYVPGGTHSTHDPCPEVSR